ncbi:MAG: BrxA/BrxB family bacilliredoxin [Cryomorphaceae bacterium]|jgi:putative YphP/YqiW family bacilliredoxin|nr:BrxA/BrxB family bacilliredoxin [Cryomorphaceae bacterium]MBT4214699.1 BrxA/BrxB family bacilliredoxin [Bacteroidota bacterium]MCH1406142.1 BrxA/BrxB family bacilliredoxin [Schleiferiaceae bacterium]MCO4775665.1 BrxA/BrxB family bacilliredoxin [Flavobacteriales bacterium]MDB9838428.1 BrxA/BrxB family bacilliredoxin [bacterium]|eukprot:GHVR01017703.1.p3 GENE.GHVR01017703.1~~GHVR01017703.1.p3  ORF type:complete len:138 (+),score=14.40 GHVR01017703.1:674-1087(+)
MYPEEMIAPMRAELANSGYTETKTADEVKSAINAEGTTFVVVNSVCGCAAGSARPAAMAAAKSAVKPTRMITVFAGNDVEAVNEARGMMQPFPPSSPSMALFKNGELVHMVERHHIEGRTAEMIAGNLLSAFEEHCK